MRKKIMAFVFAAGLVMALAVPLVGGGGAALAAHSNAFSSVDNISDNVTVGTPIEAARGDDGSDGAEDAANIAH